MNSKTANLSNVQFMTRVKLVDDSKLARDGMVYKRAPRIIHVYDKSGVGNIGTKVLLAVKGQKQKAIIVGCKNHFYKAGQPNFDSNNAVLVDDKDTPLGSRVTVAIPSSLRNHPNCSKVVSIATKFI